MKDTARSAKKDRVVITSGGIALFWLLSIFPAMFAGVALLSLLELGDTTIDNIKTAIEDTLPGGAAGILTQALQSGQQGVGGGFWALVSGIAVALWSASSGTAAAQEGLGVAYGLEDRPFLKKRLWGVVLILLGLLLGLAATALLVFAQPLGSLLQNGLAAGEWFPYIWTVVRWILGLAAVMALFTVYYLLGPNRKAPNWRWVLPGAVLATVLWAAASLGFSYYISGFGQSSFAETYGALAGVVILVLWLFLSALALMVGGELNASLERRRGQNAPTV